MKSNLGDEHPDTAIVLNNLSRVLAEEGKDEEAIKLFSESLNILKRTLGPDHPYVEKLTEREHSLTKGSSGRS